MWDEIYYFLILTQFNSQAFHIGANNFLFEGHLWKYSYFSFINIYCWKLSTSYFISHQMRGMMWLFIIYQRISSNHCISIFLSSISTCCILFRWSNLSNRDLWMLGCYGNCDKNEVFEWLEGEADKSLKWKIQIYNHDNSLKVGWDPCSYSILFGMEMSWIQHHHLANIILLKLSGLTYDQLITSSQTNVNPCLQYLPSLELWRKWEKKEDRTWWEIFWTRYRIFCNNLHISC